MELHDLWIKAWDTAHWELGEAFKGLPDDAVWVRPHPHLLSIGEIAAHVAYWEAWDFTGGNANSPLVIDAARYYSRSVGTPFQLEMGAESVYAEVQRVHQAATTALRGASPNLDDPHPTRGGMTWRDVLEYKPFHVAYHTGQIYSVRHLMGHETVDN